MKGPEKYLQGRPSWIDLATRDRDAAQDFYAALFGWEYDTPPPDVSGYSVATRDGHVVAGVTGSQDPNFSPKWITYLAVGNAAETTERARAAGAAVTVEPMSVGPAGTVAHLVDPTGAAFGLWQGAAHQGAALIDAPGSYTWAELVTTDPDAAAAFYNAALGLEAEAMDLGDQESYTVFRAGGHIVGGMMQPPTDDTPNHWQVYFGAADTDVLCAAATAAGGRVVAGPIDTSVGRMATIVDPQGAKFSAIALTEWPT